MNSEFWWPGGYFLKNLAQHYSGSSCFVLRCDDLLEFIERIFKWRSNTSFLIHYFFIVFFIFLHKLFLYVLNLLFSKGSSLNTFLWIWLEYWRMVFNFFIHFWLSKEGLILLIMAKSSITDNINEDIFFEFLSVLHCDFHASVQNIRLIGIYVDNGCPNDFGYFCTIKWWSRLPWIGSESDLIVHDDMNNTACSIVN